MSNTVITNYTDLNGPTTKADSSIVVIVNKDGSLSVDEKHLSTLMSNDRSQGAGISVVRIGHDGPPDDATDSENEDDVPHVTLSVDSYYDDPNTVIKYDSGADMFHSLRIETRENSLIGFQNDHCYTSQIAEGLTATRSDNYSGFNEPILEIKAPEPNQNVQSKKKITILDQKILTQEKKILINPSDSTVLKGNDVLSKPLHHAKLKNKRQSKDEGSDENEESSALSSSGDSMDRDSDSDYKGKEKALLNAKRPKMKPRILKNTPNRVGRSKVESRAKILKPNKTVMRSQIKEKLTLPPKVVHESKIAQKITSVAEPESPQVSTEQKKEATPKHTPRLIRKEKKTPSHVTALLSDMSSLFSTPDVIRRVSSDAKTPTANRKSIDIKEEDKPNTVKDKLKGANPKVYSRVLNRDKTKSIDPMPQIDDDSLAQILQDPPIVPTTKIQIKESFPAPTTAASAIGPLSPTLDLLAGLQPEEEGLTEDLLMHVAQLVESSENLKEVIDKQVLGKVDPIAPKPSAAGQSSQSSFVSTQSKLKDALPVKAAPPIEIVRRDGRVITLPPIEAPATRASKRKSALTVEPGTPPPPIESPEPRVVAVAKQYINKKQQVPIAKAPEEVLSPVPQVIDEPMDNADSLTSEDDPYRLWCICKQPHNNRFMICCDRCEDWFHGKCVNITKAMGQQMEEQGVEWTCPNCIKKTSPPTKTQKSKPAFLKKKMIQSSMQSPGIQRHMILSKNGPFKQTCIVCKKAARPNSIYCSEPCIQKHAQDSLGSPSPNKIDTQSGKPVEKPKLESRVIVFERKTGRCLAGPNAPTAENLKAWLQRNPTFEVVRPGTLSTTKPNIPTKVPKTVEPRKVQTTLNFEKIPRKSLVLTDPVAQPKSESKEVKTPTREDKPLPGRSLIKHTPDLAKPSTSQMSPTSMAKYFEVKKPQRLSLNRSRTSTEKGPPSPATPKRKDPERKPKATSTWSIRENVRKALQEQLLLRMKESSDSKFNTDEIKEFAEETENELHDLFKDVGVKYKAKYRSLMFNIKDRKNLSLWQKISDKSITPSQLVRLSPEELASQELAEWRDNEAKHQLDLIKKSELDLLAATKTYVLKTHKGEEVIKPKTAVSTELDPNMPVEDVVTALNDPNLMDDSNVTASESFTSEHGESRKSSAESDRSSRSKKRRKDESRSRKRDLRSETSRSSRSTRRSSQLKEKEERSTRRSEREKKSTSRDRHKKVESKKSRDRSRLRSTKRSKSKSRSHSRDRSHRRSKSRSRSKHRSRSRSRRRSTRKTRSKHESASPDTKKDKQRSKSQDSDASHNKNLNESRETEPIERPKSAMLKEIHPEYDPHEPMITSAFSDEDLRKSREDVFDESYTGSGFKGFNQFETQKLLPAEIPSESPNRIREKLSEGESDQEPSSTVDSSVAPCVWTGCINMVDVARFYVAAHEVFGNGSELEEDLSTELDIVGRINPDTVWDYISKMKRTGNKDIVVLRLAAANDEEKMQYIALYSYLSTRNRLGVVKVSNTNTVKDFYILPLPAHESLPTVLALEGASLGEARSHLLIAIIIRQRRKRGAAAKHPLPAKITRKLSISPTDEPGTPPRLPLPYVGPALSTTIKEKIAATLANADDDEPYSPGGSTSSGESPLVSAPASVLKSQMDLINRQIEEQKKQILRMAQADSSITEQEEAYSPSRPMTPPPATPLSDIALPSNLQEMLATIKEREATPTTRRQLRSFTPSQPK